MPLGMTAISPSVVDIEAEKENEDMRENYRKRVRSEPEPTNERTVLRNVPGSSSSTRKWWFLNCQLFRPFMFPSLDTVPRSAMGVIDEIYCENFMCHQKLRVKLVFNLEFCETNGIWSFFRDETSISSQVRMVVVNRPLLPLFRYVNLWINTLQFTPVSIDLSRRFGAFDASRQEFEEFNPSWLQWKCSGSNCLDQWW